MQYTQENLERRSQERSAVPPGVSEERRAPVPDEKFYYEKDFKSELRTAGAVASTEHPTAKRMITGYPAKFDKRSLDLGSFREVIKPGAFTRTLKAGADVRALVNHDPSQIFGRSTKGSLRLTEDSTGLYMEADPPDTQRNRDLMADIDAGLLDQGSFRFKTKSDAWRIVGGENIRDLLDVDLEDVSVVTFPAYLDTLTKVRSLMDAEPRVGQILVRQQHGLGLIPGDLEYIGQEIDRLTKIKQDLGDPTGSLEICVRQLQLAERELG